MKKPIIWIIVLVVVIIGLWIGMSKNTEDPSGAVLKIGGALPLTGVYASFGEEFRRGAEIAQEEINNGGEKVKVIFEDSVIEAKKSVDAVTKLLTFDKIDALFVSSYIEAAATHDIVAKKNIPMLVLWDSNPQIEEMGDKVFAIGPWTPASGEISASFIYEKGLRRVSIFGFKEKWSTAVSEAFNKKFIELGGTITTKEFANPDAKDYRTELSKAIKSNPDAIYMTTQDMQKGIRQLKELGFKGMIVSSDILDNEQISLQPALFEGVYQSQVADPETKKTSDYINLYKKKYGENPKKLLYGTWGYDAVHMLYEAYKDSANHDITAELYKIKHAGASGDISFDEKGTSKTIPKMFIVKNGIITRVSE